MAGKATNSGTDAYDNEISITLVGKHGAGKSTLARNILGLEEKLEMSASPITEKCDTKKVTKHGVTISVTDTVGLIGTKKKRSKEELTKLSKYTQGKTDILLYCIPVGPGSRFEDGNPDIMKHLQDAYGKDIWKHCIVAFTFSNLIAERKQKYTRDNSAAIAIYKNHLITHVTKFRETLKKMGVGEVEVRPVLGFQAEFLRNEHNTVVAIPAGDMPDDPVLPDFKDPFEFTISASILRQETLRIDITKWTEIFFIEMVRKCDPDLKKNLLQFRYGYTIANSIATATAAGVASGAVGGIMGGAAVGAAVGALFGLVGGPLGVIPGSIVGAGVGAGVGLVGGGTGGGAIGNLLSKNKN